jgi:magnesium-transporting ATPase (P-type)
MLPRMLISDNFKNIKKDADDFSNEGLRTLIYGYK